MAWSSKSSILSAESITNTEEYTTAVTLLEHEVARVQIEFNPPATPTDNAEIRVYETLDDSTEDWDNQATRMMVVDNADDPAFKTLPILAGPYKFRIGIVMDGSTDTGVFDVTYRKTGV